MRSKCRQNKTKQWLIFHSLSALLLLVVLFASSSSFARGPKGGGAAGALDDFDLFLLMQPSNGLPANLINGFEPANSIPGDGTVGIGGTLPFDPAPQTVISQSGDAITLLPSSVNGNNEPRAGMARKLGPEGSLPMLSLKSVAIPTTPELSKFIRDKQAAILLGKALFWDAQAGSDGNACASCHFHAGADNHMKNQLSPGLKAGDQTFQKTSSGAGGPNYKLKANDFPFHRLSNPLDRNSKVLFDSNDVVSSQGTFGGVFRGLGPNGKEFCGDRPTPDSFNVNGVITRRVPPRNSPSVINAVFNFRNFWDGRANNSFNGVNPFGTRDPNAKVLEQLPAGNTVWTTIALRNASLASQAVGPALSEFEMSCANRTFKDLGRKLLALQPLHLQKIDRQDSVLGVHVSSDQHGIKQSYPELIQAAFDPRWWQATENFDGYTQMESNFSLYWGLAIMMYESTLVSDETPFDKLIGDAGHPSDTKALTPQQLRGLGIFRGKGQCLSCHKGAEFTGAGTALQPESGEGTVVESMLLKTGELAVYDNGFYNIGVRPTTEDRGVGATDPFGNSLSLARNWFDQLRARAVLDPVWVDPCLFSIFFDASACWVAPDANSTRIVSDGAFKTPSLRNIALTQPYFHNGSQFTLEQVVAFYNRGGDRRGSDDNDTTGFTSPDSPNGGTTNLHPAINPLGLTQNESADLVAFLRHALTDPRVACERAPFDHPSLQLHNGHAGDEHSVLDSSHTGQADDQFELLPAVGRNGLKKEHCLLNDDGSTVSNRTSIVQRNATHSKTPDETIPNTPVVPVELNISRIETLIEGSDSRNATARASGLNVSNRVNIDERDDEPLRGKNEVESNIEAQAAKDIKQRGEPQKLDETEIETPPPPQVDLQVASGILVQSKVTLYGSISENTTFAWAQTDGPSVALSDTHTLTPTFTAPAMPSTLVFELTATNASGASTSKLSTVVIVSDEVTVHSVTWTKRQSNARGNLQVIASSSAIKPNAPLPNGMGMIVTFWNNTLASSTAGSESHPISLPMSLSKADSSVCGIGLQCFELNVSDMTVNAVNPLTIPGSLPPSTIIVSSSLGGLNAVTGNKIKVH